MSSEINKPFASTEQEHRGKKVELLVKFCTLAMTWLLIIPVLAIIVFLVYKAWPALSI